MDSLHDSLIYGFGKPTQALWYLSSSTRDCPQLAQRSDDDPERRTGNVAQSGAQLRVTDFCGI